jgi:hypothetical protein
MPGFDGLDGQDGQDGLPGSKDHAQLSGVTRDQHHDEQHFHDGTVAPNSKIEHINLAFVSADQHHNKSHAHDNADGSGFIQGVGARVYRNVDQNISNNTDTILNFNSERYDTATFHDNTTNNSRLTAPVTGIYVIFFNIEFAANSVGNRLGLLLVNGTNLIGCVNNEPEGSTITRLNCSVLYQLTAGDYVEVQVRQSSGGVLAVVSESEISPEFGMSLI